MLAPGSKRQFCRKGRNFAYLGCCRYIYIYMFTYIYTHIYIYNIEVYKSVCVFPNICTKPSVSRGTKTVALSSIDQPPKGELSGVGYFRRRSPGYPR